MKTGSLEVFRRLSAWSKNIPAAYRHGVDFGAPVDSGMVGLVDNTIITDDSQAFTVDGLITKILLIMSPGDTMNLYKVITDNTATTVTLATPFSSDVLGKEYIITDAVKKYLLYYICIDSWDINLLTGIESFVLQALVSYVAKEWYKTNRWMDDFQIEEAEYQGNLGTISSQLFQTTKRVKRAGELLY
jgi:hypothetical protein